MTAYPQPTEALGAWLSAYAQAHDEGTDDVVLGGSADDTLVTVRGNAFVFPDGAAYDSDEAIDRALSLGFTLSLNATGAELVRMARRLAVREVHLFVAACRLVKARVAWRSA